MPRRPRGATGGTVFHVLNRANAKATLFEHGGDYLAFEQTLAEALERFAVRLLAYCVMPNHWHLVLWPEGDRDMPAFMQWLTATHVRRWHAYHQTTGMGHVYQGRYRAFPVQNDEHFLTACRYVERNAARAGLVSRAEQWRWCSLWWLEDRSAADYQITLSPWPLPRPTDWLDRVNAPLASTELAELQQCVRRGRPYGGPRWSTKAASRLGLQAALRPRGRPRKND